MPHEEDEESGRESADRRRFLKAIGALGVVGLAGCGGDGDGDDTDTLTDTDPGGDGNGDGNGNGNGDTPTEEPTETPTPTETDTPTPTDTPAEDIPEDPASLLSFGEDSRRASSGGTVTIEGQLVNPYLFDLQDVEITLAGPSDDWGIEATGDTSFDTLESQGDASVGWEVTVPESAEGDQTLTATVEYASATDEATTEVTTGVNVVPPAPDVTAPITDGLAGQIDASVLSETDGLSLWQAVNAEGRTGALAQSDGDAQPSVVADASATGESVVRFEGDGDFMSTNAPLTTATSGVTMIVAFRIDDKEKLRQVIAFNGSDQGGNGYGLILNSEADSSEVDASVDILYGGVNWWYSDLTIEDDAIHVATLVIPSDSAENPRLFLDGEEPSFELQGSASPPGTPSSQYGIGQDEVAVDQPPFLDGDVGEQLIYERELSQSEREEIENYLIEKWVGSE